jgi:asparagine synthetase B (glutamine-hydrolysing)
MDAARTLRRLTARAVSDALGPKVGAVLSGGIDSSTIVAFAGDLPTFTGYYDGRAYDERPYARLVAGSKHHEILITPEDFVANFDAMLAAAKPPYQGMGTFGQYMVAKYACEHVETVLSGEGGDELFGGYARLLWVAGEPLPDGYEGYQLPPGYPHDLKEALAWDWERLPDLLAVDEQMTSAFGLKAVAPFTDQRVVDFVLSLPARERVGKKLLKEAMRGILPEQILNRTDKRGFPAPLVEWAQTEPVKSFVQERIGYIPQADRPWDRGWWLELCEVSTPGRDEVAA